MISEAGRNARLETAIPHRGESSATPLTRRAKRGDTPLNNLWDYLRNQSRTALGRWICRFSLGETMIFKQWWIDMRARLAALLRRREIYRRTNEELEFHLAML